ncbi:hypothetical protein NN561_010013 [Cricetulus griseus]
MRPRPDGALRAGAALSSVLLLLLLLLPLLGHLRAASTPGPSSSSPGTQQDNQLGAGRVKRGWVWNQFFVVEEYTGTEPLYVGKIHSDSDEGDGTIKYTISGEGAGTIFLIDELTGDIHATERLDREQKTFYTLRAQARDRATNRLLEPESEFIIKVQDINDSEPRFLHGPYIGSVAELSPTGTSVMQVMASDADDPTYGSSARLVYSVLDGEHHFTVDPKTGSTLTFPRMHWIFPLYPCTTATVTLALLPAPARFPSQEHFANAGLYLAATARYAIDRDSDLEQIFDIDADTGAIVTGKGLDRETAGWHNITVLAMEADNHAQLSRASLRIRILDVNDNPPELATPYEAAVCEDAKPGQLIQTISVVDRDEPQSGHRFYFRLVPEAPSNPHFSLLDIQDNTAAVHTQHVGFNRQEQDVFLLPILVVDSGPPTLSSTGTLTIRICGCDSSGTIQSCNTTAFVMAASLSPGALIALLVCVLILVVLALLILTLRRHHKSHLSSDVDEDMRDNVIKYNDEGGGEQDTEAYDMSALRSLYDFGELKGGDAGGGAASPPQAASSSERHSLPRGPSSPEPDFSVFRDFISRKVALADADLSVPPYDAFQTYAFEGAGSPAASLSSLHSGSTGSEQDFAFLRAWGPRFRPLAALYAGHRGDDEAPAS